MADSKYADMLRMEHHVSRRHPPMSREDRAAQFSPFAALTGYDDLVAESARETEARIEPDEQRIEELNRSLLEILENGLPAEYTVFVPDRNKAGGSYRTVSGTVKKYDPIAGTILLDNGECLAIETITKIG